MTFGNKLYRVVRESRLLMFDIGERIALSRTAFTYYRDNISVASNDSVITVRTPIGLHPNDEVMESEYKYQQSQLKYTLNKLCIDELPIDGLYKMVTMVEGILIQVLDEILQKYPSKVGSKIKVDAGVIIESQSLEELKRYLFKRIINDITYKSPEDFAKEFKDFTGIDLGKFAMYNNYIELKATRDLYMHNNGIVNEIYLRKAKGLGRALENEKVVCDYDYFLKCYEVCLQLVEFIVDELNTIWESSEYLEWKARVVEKFINK
ncbi:hypothetical protein [Chryseobacterium sediminis]|uniref:Uncharacterized protein n=1 Tax=Chryseobacterium sediminis TaxID=1679494 RepID=A0A5B2U911_9FLAO|nr:hypothetical protein [Chryseobacterium sediminis]KAA2223131.1 hypothetical protein FW780_02695 [Chryseobacterium sediminis]